MTTEARHAEVRHLHLRCALGKARTEVWNGKEYLVVPVVALMEGVIHAVNAETPEFVPFSTLQRAAPSWNDKPAVLFHPKRGGKQCSANSPDILESHGMGVIRNSRVDEGTKRLLQEAWVEKGRAKKLHPDMYARLEAGESEEVSVGAFVATDSKPGQHNGRRYAASWVEVTGDHLAFLPGGRGACSLEMGCGAHRAASHLVTAEGFRTLEEVADDMRLCQVLTTLEGQSLDDRIQAVHVAVSKRWQRADGGGNVTTAVAPYSYAYAQQIFDSSVIVKVDDKLFALPYDVAADGSVTLGAQTEVKQTYVAAGKYKDCPTCGGTGQVKVDGKQQDCTACEGEGRLRAAAGARHSAMDMGLIQAVHDHAMALGATCDRGNYEELAGRAVAGREDNPTRFYIETVRREAARAPKAGAPKVGARA